MITDDEIETTTTRYRKRPVVIEAFQLGRAKRMGLALLPNSGGRE